MASRWIAAALAAFGSVAVASDQVVSFSDGAASFNSAGVVLDGGDDVISFSGLDAGSYNFSLTLSGQYLELSDAVLNGVAGTIIDTGRWTFVGIEGESAPSFVLSLAGVASARALYSGELTVTAVPEPSTYALMLAGLSAVGFIARRRRRD